MTVKEVIGPDIEMQLSLTEATRRIKQLESIVGVLADRLEAIDLQTLCHVLTTQGVEIRSRTTLG